MAETAPPRLSVVVTSYDSPAVLRRCLAALSGQTEVDEVVVSDCFPDAAGRNLASEFSQVRFCHSAEKKRVPELRWAALPYVSGDIVGALEARCEPAPDWARLILAEHLAHPEAPAIGGPVAAGTDLSAFELGLYFCEYGAFATPLALGSSPALSGANLSYKREALTKEGDLLAAGAWETFLHERWRAQGRELRLCGATVTFHNAMTPGAAFAQRYHYGRGYAADRATFEGGARRVWYALLSPLLPLLLTARTARQAVSKHRAFDLLRALGWVAALHTAWSAGEAVGYLLGADPRPRIF